MNEQTKEQLDALIADAVKNALAENTLAEKEKSLRQRPAEVDDEAPLGIWDNTKLIVNTATQPITKSLIVINRGLTKLDVWSASAFANSITEQDLEDLEIAEDICDRVHKIHARRFRKRYR